MLSALLVALFSTSALAQEEKPYFADAERLDPQNHESLSEALRLYSQFQDRAQGKDEKRLAADLKTLAGQVETGGIKLFYVPPPLGRDQSYTPRIANGGTAVGRHVYFTDPKPDVPNLRYTKFLPEHLIYNGLSILDRNATGQRLRAQHLFSTRLNRKQAIPFPNAEQAEWENWWYQTGEIFLKDPDLRLKAREVFGLDANRLNDLVNWNRRTAQVFEVLGLPADRVESWLFRNDEARGSASQNRVGFDIRSATRATIPHEYQHVFQHASMDPESGQLGLLLSRMKYEDRPNEQEAFLVGDVISELLWKWKRYHRVPRKVIIRTMKDLLPEMREIWRDARQALGEGAMGLELEAPHLDVLEQRLTELEVDGKRLARERLARRQARTLVAETVDASSRLTGGTPRTRSQRGRILSGLMTPLEHARKLIRRGR